MKKSKFETQCEKVSEDTGIDVMFFDDDTNPAPCEDDGNLHITKRGLRACFDVGMGQNATGKVQNERAKKVLEALKITKFKPEMVFVDETEDDDDECPCCGRSRHD